MKIEFRYQELFICRLDWLFEIEIRFEWKYFKPDGCAYVSSGLRVGHVIIELNGYSMKGLSHRQAALSIASAFKDKNTSTMNLTVVEPLTD